MEHQHMALWTRGQMKEAGKSHSHGAGFGILDTQILPIHALLENGQVFLLKKLVV